VFIVVNGLLILSYGVASCVILLAGLSIKICIKSVYVRVFGRLSQ